VYRSAGGYDTVLWEFDFHGPKDDIGLDENAHSSFEKVHTTAHFYTFLRRFKRLLVTADRYQMLVHNKCSSEEISGIDFVSAPVCLGAVTAYKISIQGTSGYATSIACPETNGDFGRISP
jgi:hypothetical protein